MRFVKRTLYLVALLRKKTATSYINAGMWVRNFQKKQYGNCGVTIRPSPGRFLCGDRIGDTTSQLTQILNQFDAGIERCLELKCHELGGRIGDTNSQHQPKYLFDGTGWRRLIGSPRLQIIFHKEPLNIDHFCRK